MVKSSVVENRSNDGKLRALEDAIGQTEKELGKEPLCASEIELTGWL